MHNQQLWKRIQTEESTRETFRTDSWNCDTFELTSSYYEDAFCFLSANHSHDKALEKTLSECDQVEKSSTATFLCYQLNNSKDRM